jgi:stage II sporulation protein D
VKNIFFYILGFIFLCFLIPIVFTKVPKRETASLTNISENEVTEPETPKVTTKYAKVKLLHSKSGEVEEMSMEEYLVGVVSAEMPANFELEALKAQAVVARTYTAYKMFKGGKHDNANICDDSKCCQAWISKEDRFEKWNEADRENNWSKITTAVNETKGKIITYNGEPINAFFHSNSGGTTETVSNVWGGTDYPYLQSVETSGEDGYTQYSSSVTLSKEELLQKMKESYPNITINWNEEQPIQITEYTESGRVKTIKILLVDL